MARSKDYSKTNMYRIPPHDLVRVTDKAHALYDPRVALPADPQLVESIEAWGVRKPLRVTKDADGNLLIVDGRRRHAAACVVAEKQAKAKVPVDERLKVPVLYEPIPGDAPAGMAIDNEHTLPPSPLQRAEAAARYVRSGLDAKQIAKIYSVTHQTVSGWLAMLDASPETRAAVVAGEVAASVALAEGRANTGRTRKSATNGAPAKTAEGKVRPKSSRAQLSVTTIRKIYMAIPANENSQTAWVRHVIGVVLGAELPSPTTPVGKVLADALAAAKGGAK